MMTLSHRFFHRYIQSPTTMRITSTPNDARDTYNGTWQVSCCELAGEFGLSVGVGEGWPGVDEIVVETGNVPGVDVSGTEVDVGTVVVEIGEKQAIAAAGRGDDT